FVLGCFLDFFEIAFIVIPILVPVATKILPELMPGVPIDAVMIWFGVILAVNLQTSFLTPPFGFALFYLRSVAAKTEYQDRVTGATIPAVKTSQIYKGSIAFLFLQVIVLASIITFPQLVVSGISKGPQIDADAALEAFRLPGPGKLAPVPSFGFPAPGASAPEGGAAAPAEPGAAADDPMKAILEAVQKEAEAKK
ncbi:MAG: TRAP transporter large permease subunit, partial [Rhodoferax sp.]|nr:TRAP transporter large permease subunit [Rhodoferax sp.]